MPKKPVNPQKGISWSEVIAIFTSITGFVTSVLVWLDIAQYGQLGFQNFLWAGIVAAVVVWGIILYLLYKQKNIAFSVGLAVTMVALVIVGIWWTSNKKAEEERVKARDEKLIVLIAAFDGPEEVYGLRNEIIEKLSTDFPKGGEVEIETTDEIITPELGSERARELGKDVQADVVIWGWYRPTEKPNITIHIENLSPNQLLPLKESEKLQPATTLSDLESFSFQQQTSQETSALISFLSGFINYNAENYMVAIERFDKSLESFSKTPKLIENQGDIYAYRGNTKYYLNDYQGAIRDYDRTIQINSQFVFAYNNRGVVYCYLESVS
jgi:tetratricopeptide (TPR) repeat protein